MSVDKCKYCKGSGIIKIGFSNLKCICKYADASKDLKILIGSIYEIGILKGVNILVDSLSDAIKDVTKERLKNET